MGWAFDDLTSRQKRIEMARGGNTMIGFGQDGNIKYEYISHQTNIFVTINIHKLKHFLQRILLQFFKNNINNKIVLNISSNNLQYCMGV